MGDTPPHRRPASRALSVATRLALLSVLALSPQASRAQTPRPGGAAGSLSHNPAAHKPEGEPRPDGAAKSDDAGVASLDIGELLKQVLERGADMHKHLLDYTYTLKTVRRELGDKGSVKTEEERTFEAYPVRGEHLLIRQTKDGREMPGWLVDADRKEVVRALERAEAAEGKTAEAEASQTSGAGKASEPSVVSQPAPAPGRWVAAGVSGRSHGKIVYVSIDAAELLRSAEFHSPRRERLAGRDAIAIQFRARPGLNLPPKKAYITSLVGTVWIDPADKAVMRIEGWPAPLPAPAPGEEPPPPRRFPDHPAFVYQQARLADGAWVPSLLRMDACGDGALFNGLNWDVTFEFRDYKRFGSAVEKIEVNPDAPQRP
jgi:hypothetical protein